MPSELKTMRRRVSIAIKGKKTVSGELIIYKPVASHSGTYVCKWKLKPYFQHEEKIFGADQLSAFFITLAFIRRILKDEEARGVIIYWNRKGDCAGIPRTLMLPK